MKREEEEMRLKAEEESRQQALAKAKVLQEQRDKVFMFQICFGIM